MAAATEVRDDDGRLRIQARLLERLLDRPDRVPARWATPGFGRLVDLVRAQLGPIISHESLAESYSREHIHRGVVGVMPGSLVLLRRSPTDVGYAHRWLELAGQAGGEPWATLVSEDRHQAGRR